MKQFSAAFAAVIVLLATGGVVQSQAQKGGGDLTGEYELVTGWPQNWCGDGYVIGSTAGIWAEAPDRVIVFARGCLPRLENPGDLTRRAMPPASISRRRIRRVIRAGITS